MREINVGVSWLRTMNAQKLKDQKDVAILHEHAEPIAVLFPYSQFMALQALRKKLTAMEREAK